MNINKILNLANSFYKLAAVESEELPENSKDINVVLKNLEKLETYKARKAYAEKNLKHLSSGSSRVVYLTPEKTVLKLAKNDKGIAQNKAESNPKMKSKYLNKILKFAKHHEWIETTYLDKIIEKQFEKMTGIDFSDFGDSVRYELKSEKSKPDDFDEISKSDIFKEITKVAKKFKLIAGDIVRISSWLTDGKIPILGDAGLTKEIFEKFYED